MQKRKKKHKKNSSRCENVCIDKFISFDILISVAMGKTISEEERNKKAWDSNAITPGTPFMDLLAISL
jgi:5'-3' exonuclease